MKTVIKGLATFLSLSLMLLIHEFGHFTAMRSLGVPVEAFSIGIPVPYMTAKTQLRLYPGTTFQISPLILGGAVSPAKEARRILKAMPISDVTHVYARGAEFGLYVGSAILLLLNVRKWSERSRTRKLVVLIPTGLSVCTIVMPFATEFFLFPLIGIAQIIYVVISRGQGITGPIEVGKMFMKNAFQGCRIYLEYFAIIILAITAINTLPIEPFDSAKPISALIARHSERAADIYFRGSLILLLLVVCVIVLAPMVRRLIQLNAELRHPPTE